MRILVSTPIVGGVGGMERSVFASCEAFPDAEIDVYAGRILEEGFVPSGSNVRLGSLSDWARAKAGEPRTFDVYLQFRAANTVYLLQDGLEAKAKLLIPCGHPTGGAEVFFDHVLNEAKDGSRYLKLKTRGLTIPPPVRRMTEDTQDVPGLPSKYYLTVFNPYSLERPYADGVRPTKGHDVLYWVTPRSQHPIVWAYSDMTQEYPPERIRESPNLRPIRNLSQPQLAHLYERAAGYVSFSREEGFGWAVADAMLCGLPIFSRETGVVTLIQPQTRGLHLYDSREELLRLLNDGPRTERTQYDTEVFAPNRFRRALLDLLEARTS